MVEGTFLVNLGGTAEAMPFVPVEGWEAFFIDELMKFNENFWRYKNGESNFYKAEVL